MNEPKRYGFHWLECDATDEAYMAENGMTELKDGGFVLWQDYALLKAENARLKAEVERLRKAGDDLEFLACFNYSGDINEDEHSIKILDAWNAAKEGKPSV